MQITIDILNNLKDNKLLSKWEADFIESVAGQFAIRGTLSANQLNIVERCIEKTSADKVKETNDWNSSYDEVKRNTAKLVATYYKREGYFQYLSDCILNDESFVPSKEQYEKMCENKYAKRVVEAHNRPYEFQVGDLAVIRSGIRRNSLEYRGGKAPFTNHASYVGQLVVIIEHDVSRPRLCKMVHCTLLTDPSYIFSCDEKFLKKNRKKD